MEKNDVKGNQARKVDQLGGSQWRSARQGSVGERKFQPYAAHGLERSK